MTNFFSKYKFIFYIVNIVLVVLYLFPGSLLGYFFYGDSKIEPQLMSNFIISTNHLYSFFIISVLGIFTYFKSKNVNFLILYLIFLSIILEIFHIVIPNRSFEILDLFGNLIGVLIVVIINYFYNKYEKYKN